MENIDKIKELLGWHFHTIGDITFDSYDEEYTSGEIVRKNIVMMGEKESDENMMGEDINLFV